mmetsp:Transcript_11755/g.18410  ORF Transcript_11755/g.18410 Transcript_11755/m.18410 type:complete len:228 (+) Transcript_11755:20-703(+)
MESEVPTAKLVSNDLENPRRVAVAVPVSTTDLNYLLTGHARLDHPPSPGTLFCAFLRERPAYIILFLLGVAYAVTGLIIGYEYDFTSDQGVCKRWSVWLIVAAWAELASMLLAFTIFCEAFSLVLRQNQAWVSRITKVLFTQGIIVIILAVFIQGWLLYGIWLISGDQSVTDSCPVFLNVFTQVYVWTIFFKSLFLPNCCGRGYRYRRQRRNEQNTTEEEESLLYYP